MADESLNFKFTLDLSDFDKASDVVADAMHKVAQKAKEEGEDADKATLEFLRTLIEERKSAAKEIEQASKEAMDAWHKAWKDGDDSAIDQISDHRDELIKLGNENYAIIRTLIQKESELEQKILSTAQAENEQVKTTKELSEAQEEASQTGGGFLFTILKQAGSADLYKRAMSMLPAPIANVVKSTKGLDMALKGLLANPVVLVIAGVVMAIKLLGDAIKGVFSWLDGLADRNEFVAYWFGVVTGAIEKFVNAFNELLYLNVDGFLYNIKTMFDGGEREIAKRNEDLRRVEEQGLRERLNRDNQFLRRRMNNTKLDMKDRLDAEKQYTANLRTIEETRRAELERKMTEWSKKNGLRTAENPEGWATDISQLAGPLQVELQEMYNEMARIDNAMADITEESKDRLVKMRDQVHSEFEANMKWLDDQVKARKQYQRQVREALEAEAERLQAMSTQTENMVIQSQIKEMADGIEKVTKEAQFKTKQAYEALDKTLVDEAKKLYNNEKAIYEGNPDNEGKMFKAFKLDDYVRQARQNIGYGIRKELISNEEISTIKKAADDVANKALEGAKKVSDEVHKTFTELTKMSGVEAPSFMDSYDRFTTGIDDAIKATTSFKNITDEIEETQRNVLKLQMKRLKLEVQINNTADPKEKVELAQKLEEANKSINVELEKGKRLLSDQSKAGEKVKTAYEKIKSNASQIVDAMSEIASQFKDISDAGDDMVDAMQQMMSFAGKIVSGDYLGAMLQVVMVIGKGIADTVKSIRHASDVSDETYEKMKKVSEATYALAQAAESYRMNMLDAKDAKDALYDTTNIKAMLDAQKKLNEATDNYQRYINSISVQNGRGTSKGFNAYVESINGIQVDMTPRNEFNKQYWDLNKYITTQFKSPLFSVDENGEYKLNTGIWKQIKENNDALVLFNDTQVKQLDNIAQWQDKIVEAQQEVTSGIADWFSPLLDNMTDAMMDWLTANEDIMDRFKEYSSDTFRQIVEDLIKRMLYKDIFAKYTDEIDALTKEYLDTGNEQSYAQSIASVTDSLIKTLDDNKERSKAIWDAWESSMNEIGIDMNETAGRNAEARGIARASQESVDENNARLAMMQQHTYSINANVAQLVAFSASALEHLQGIHTNTNELRRLERIENSLANIETYGVRTR